MKQATFDPARELTLYFRCNRAGQKDFVFTYADGSAYSFIYDELELNIYKNQGDKWELISLDHVSGITLNGNTVTVSITKALSNIDEGEYYWELYRTDLEKTWLCGDAIFHNGKFDGVTTDSETITVTEDGEDITITVNDPNTSLLDLDRHTTNYTLVLTDADKLIELDSASAISLTVPPNSQVAFEIGTVIIINQYGAGTASVVAGSGVTIRSANGALSISAQYAGASLIKRDTNEWYLNGSIA